VFIAETTKIDFGRLPEWNCPIPDTDAKSAVTVHDEVTTAQSVSDVIVTTSQSLVKEVNTIFTKILYYDI